MEIKILSGILFPTFPSMATISFRKVISLLYCIALFCHFLCKSQIVIFLCSEYVRILRLLYYVMNEYYCTLIATPRAGMLTQ